jgi:hypothetical protein
MKAPRWSWSEWRARWIRVTREDIFPHAAPSGDRDLGGDAGRDVDQRVLGGAPVAVGGVDAGG